MEEKEKWDRICNYWWRGAEDDYEAGEILLSSGKYRQALFFLHLAIEKALKALFVRRQKDYAPLTHNLVFLFGKVFPEKEKKILDFLIEISGFSIEMRYPDEEKET